jgi:putative ABC transport system ATP-binding protein
MIFQSFNLIPTMTARQNVALALAFGGMPKRERETRAAELLARVALAQRADHRPTELSGGEQQRVSIARALANDPQVLLADEPTGNLDSARGHEIMAILKGLNSERGLTIAMVTHEADIAEYASRTIRFADGLIVGDRRKDAA